MKGHALFDPSRGSIATPDVFGDISIVQTTASAIAAVVVTKIMVALHILFRPTPSDGLSQWWAAS